MMTVLESEVQWTDVYLFQERMAGFRTSKKRNFELATAEHTDDRPGRYSVAVKVVDIFGSDPIMALAS